MSKRILILGSLILTLCVNVHAQTISWLQGIHSNGSDDIQAIALDSSGNVGITGWFSDTAFFDPLHTTLTSSGELNGFVALCDGSGNLQWLKKIAGVSQLAGNAIGFDNAGNCYVTGAFFDTITFPDVSGSTQLISAGSIDIFIAKYNHSGNLLWAKRAGGSFSDYGAAISVRPNGKFAVVGDFEGESVFQGIPTPDTVRSMTDTASDMFIAFFDGNGNVKWVKEGGGPDYDYGNAVVVDSDNNVYAGGIFRETASFINNAASLTSAGSTDDVVMKLDSSGNLIWATRIGSAEEDYLNGIGLCGSKCFIVARDGNGSPAANVTITYDSAGHQVVLASLLGPFTTIKSGGVCGINRQTGFVQLYKLINDSGYCNPTAFGVNSDTIVVGGEFKNKVSFDHASDSTTITSIGEDDIWIGAWDSTGSFFWVRTGGSSGNDFMYSLAAHGGQCVAAGTYEDTLTFEGMGLVSSGLEDAFFLSFGDSYHRGHRGAHGNQPSIESSIVNAKNGDALTIETDGQQLIIHGNLQHVDNTALYDVLGNPLSYDVASKAGSDLILTLRSMYSGVVIYRIKTNTDAYSGKFLKYQ